MVRGEHADHLGDHRCADRAGSSRAQFGVSGAVLPLVLGRQAVAQLTGLPANPSIQLTFGPYVADTSRYLSSATSVRSTFWWTYGGTVLGAGLGDVVRRAHVRRGGQGLQGPRSRVRRRPRRRCIS
ncbi:hypothetical protein [Amycolatopsis sp. H20-H5]|uniref:hypothetical protein n=1 Tax=Amycolatopsis sp. H20-H5 TaxID=3046309 RepID=UPI002DBE1838|nr:hypothetical protein [Amycolatopsis sp. H20-H5]MEC3975612.1 hypothetical protein [Amycolatopsis sp. H20-H5]